MIVPTVIVPVADGADSVIVFDDEIVPVVMEPNAAVTVKVELVVTAPKVMEPAEAVNVELEFVEIAPVVRLPVEAVIVKPVLVLLIAPVETVPPEIVTAWAVESAPVVIVPLAAVIFIVTD